ncbi:hypothetical protein PsorP6_012554 [Peronosclerospora sorghi]|uniref:Uncharacterized protein n=1 Tax=Peronosclerospora sorghi TaxID=230839 RepID=A0ACC0WHU6_9STRA|nr:hypothetical protein PsorP6_012554 [Peronosclerospora sorghi]
MHNSRNEVRNVFAKLLVFEQDFDTAMQILRFQDEKVARLSLEDPEQMKFQQASTSRRPSKKRKRPRPNSSQAARSEPPVSPFKHTNQKSNELHGEATTTGVRGNSNPDSTDVAVSTDTNRTSWSDLLKEHDDKVKQSPAQTRSDTSSRRLPNIVFQHQEHLSSCGGPLCSTANKTALVTSLLSTGSGKAVSMSKPRLRLYEEKLRNDEEPVSDGTGVSTAVSTSISNASMVPSLSSTGSGKAVSVSNLRLSVYENQSLNGDEAMNCVRNSFGGADGVLHCDGATDKQRAYDGCGGKMTLIAKRSSVGLMPRPTVADQLNNIARSRDIVVTSDFLRETENRDVGPSNPRRDDPSFSDKENVHPENLLVSKIVALKAWPPAHSSEQMTSKSGVRCLKDRQVRRPMIANRALKPSIEPRSKVTDKSRFHPPVPSKRFKVHDSNGLRDSGQSVLPRSKRQQDIAVDVKPYIYQESMKISLTSLIMLYKNSSLAEGNFEHRRRQVLNCITAQNALNVCFSRYDDLIISLDNSYDTEHVTGPRELYYHLRSKKHILKTRGATFAWFLNHYRWVVWKLAATERSFPHVLLEKYLTKEQVLKQMTHRYQRDLNDAQRSIVKKILNRDASSCSCMVLCIAAVLPFPVNSTTLIDQELPASWNLALVLTDGWYSVYAVPDAPLAAVLWKLHAKSSITGTKIATWNASLQNSIDGIDPLDCAIVRESEWQNPLLAKENLSQWPYLYLRYNSTRRVRFDTRLGVEKLRYVIPPTLGQQKPQPPPVCSLLKSVPLKSLEVGGGMVRSVRVRVVRISPVLYLQAKEYMLGPHVLCEEQLPLYLELRSQYSQAVAQKKHQKGGVDVAVDTQCSSDQADIPPPIPFVKLDVECTHPSVTNRLGVGCGILTIWRPSEDLLSGGIKEGVEYFVSSLTINWKIDGGRGHDAFLRLSSTKHSTFEEVHGALSPIDGENEAKTLPMRGQRLCVDVQQATVNYRAHFEGLSGRRNEKRPTIDVCVCIVSVATREMLEDSIAVTKRQAQVSLLDPGIKPRESRFVEHVFGTDLSGHLMSIRLFGMIVSMPKTSPISSTRSLSSSFVFRRGSDSMRKEGAILCFRDLEVSHYDEQLRLLDCVMVESTQIVSSPSRKSPFWDPYHLLQSQVGSFTTRYSPRHLLPPLSNFAKGLLQLKQYVELEILQTDGMPSQEVDAHHLNMVEHEQLTQELQSHTEAETATAEVDVVDREAATTRCLRWEAHVIKLMPLPSACKVVFSSRLIAFACVKIGTHENGLRTIYLTRHAMRSMHAVLYKTAPSCPNEGMSEIPDVKLVQLVVELLGKLTQRKLECVFRFDVRQATNERLISSWKPWERLHASYWIAETVAATQG